MRTTRVEETTNSIFRNSRQYLHSNEQIFRAMQESELSQFVGRRGNRKGKKRQEKSHSPRRPGTNSKTAAVHSIDYDALSISSLQNYLLKHSEKIEMARRKISCIRAYRSSI